MMVITKTIIIIILFVLVCSDANGFLFASGAAGKNNTHNQVIMCKDNEREALLTIKQGLTITYVNFSTNLSSWGSAKENKDCCNWDGVACNNITGHVIELYLHRLRGEISPALLELGHLKLLHLETNDFGGNKIPELIGSLDKLEHLHLSDCNFSGDVPYQLGNLTNLRFLDLSYDSLISKNLSWLSNLTLLSTLDLSGNQFDGPVSWLSNLTLLSTLHLHDNQFDGPVSWISNLTLLSTLSLSNNHFEGPVSWLSNLTLLSTLDLSDNQFDGPVSWLSNLTLLSRLDLSGNKFEVPLPDLKAFSSLKYLLLQRNKLIGQLPAESIGLLSNLKYLDVSYNSFIGTISEAHLSQLHNLRELELSFNSLALNFSSHWIPPFQLDRIGLAGCNVGPSFPSWLQTQTGYTYLHLSHNNISEEVPHWFWNHSVPLNYLNLSHNSMSGLVPDTSTKLLYTNLVNLVITIRIDISFNNFSGPLPSFDSSSNILDLSHNMFNGTIQSICRTEYFQLASLDLSYNQLSGDLSNCFQNMPNLIVLNLAENKLHGHIPPSLGSLVNITTLVLRNNHFTGELPSALSACEDLQLIDCGGNGLTGDVPAWTGSLTNLVFLILTHNSFYGNIPPEICRLSKIQVLDLSHNNISGTIPQCFQNFTSLVQTNGSTDVATVKLIFYVLGMTPNGNDLFHDNVIVRWKRQESEYKSTLGLLKLIDLSSNNLVGSIPSEISRLAGLASFNLSHNHLTGNIISEIGQMKMLESLDLSRNNLSGEIPVSLAELNYLAILDLSSNNLSGKIPQGSQSHTFDASAYAENTGLCGQPLPNCPVDNPPPRPSAANRGNQAAIEDQKEGFTLIQSFIIEEDFLSVILGYIVGFWVIIGPLVIKRTWREAYFGYLSMIGDWFYVTLTLSWTRLIRYLKSRE